MSGFQPNGWLELECCASKPLSMTDNSAVSTLSRPAVGAKPGGVRAPVIVPLMRRRERQRL
jgi:hypothetical protein